LVNSLQNLIRIPYAQPSDPSKEISKIHSHTNEYGIKEENNIEYNQNNIGKNNIETIKANSRILLKILGGISEVLIACEKDNLELYHIENIIILIPENDLEIPDYKKSIIGNNTSY